MMVRIFANCNFFDKFNLQFIIIIPSLFYTKDITSSF